MLNQLITWASPNDNARFYGNIIQSMERNREIFHSEWPLHLRSSMWRFYIHGYNKVIYIYIFIIFIYIYKIIIIKIIVIIIEKIIIKKNNNI